MKNTLTSFLFFLLFFPFSSQAQLDASSQTVKNEIVQWSIKAISDKSEGQIKVYSSGMSFTIINHPVGSKIIEYGWRKYGINLVWGPDYDMGESGNIRFENKNGSSILKTTNLFAIYVAQGGYLYYKKRKYGINLEFSSTPKYEWTLEGVGGGNEEVVTDQSYSLKNNVINDYVVYCPREYGINLRWSEDCKK